MKPIDQCPDCHDILYQDWAAGGWRYLSCMNGHFWKKGGNSAGKGLFPATDIDPGGPKQLRKAWADHTPKIPEQDERFSWCYRR